MLDAWLWTAKKNLRGAPISPPEDFRREGGEIKFVPGVFADRVAELLLTRGLKVEGCEDGDSGGKADDDAGGEGDDTVSGSGRADGPV
jgi:hypothetical protein